MNKPQVPPAPAPEPATLAEQKSDFTAEGSPPPGKVSTSIPVNSTVEQKKPAPSAPGRGATKPGRPPTAGAP
jgi:hypothetical protein